MNNRDVDQLKPKLLDQVREALQVRHYSPRTETSYIGWIKRFIFFHNVRHPGEMAEPEINAFLSHLALKKKISASTQNQALSALLFLYRHVLGREVGNLGDVVRARKPRRLPVVMTREDVKAILNTLTGNKKIMATLMYGAGLRLMECLQLRVQDIDFSRNEILVRNGKGAKDRIAMLPESIKISLNDHLKEVKTLHEHDLADGWDAFKCLSLWIENIPMHQSNGVGNGFFPRSTDGRISRRVKKGGTTWTNHWFKKL